MYTIGTELDTSLVHFVHLCSGLNNGFRFLVNKNFNYINLK